MLHVVSFHSQNHYSKFPIILVEIKVGNALPAPCFKLKCQYNISLSELKMLVRYFSDEFKKFE